MHVSMYEQCSMSKQNECSFAPESNFKNFMRPIKTWQEYFREFHPRAIKIYLQGNLLIHTGVFRRPVDT